MKKLLYILALLLAAQTLAQTYPKANPPPLPQGTVYYKARFAYYSPDGSHLLASLCKTREGSCTPWRYYLADKRWEAILTTPTDPAWSLDSATYSKDGKSIAVSVVKCLGDWRDWKCPLFNFRLGVIDAQTGRLRILPSEQSRFMPSFTPDGRSLVYYGLDNATPARSGQAVYASHNLYTVDLDGSNVRKVISVKTQRPLIPPKVLSDGRTVTIAVDREFFGEVFYKDEIQKRTDEDAARGFRVGSVILGDMVTGRMNSLYPKGFEHRTIFDLSNTDAVFLHSLSHYQLKIANVSSPAEETLLAANPRGGHSFSHASFAPNSQDYACVLTDNIALRSLVDAGKHSYLLLPTWQSQ